MSNSTEPITLSNVTETLDCIVVEKEIDLATVEWWRWVLITTLITLSGCFSGLNLGVLGLEVSDLEIIAEEPFADPDEKARGMLARKLLPIRRRGNLLLCAILLGNVAVNSLLSILSADIVGSGAGFFISTGLIVIFGEIVP